MLGQSGARSPLNRENSHGPDERSSDPFNGLHEPSAHPPARNLPGQALYDGKTFEVQGTRLEARRGES